jgi:hypothetical protein
MSVATKRTGGSRRFQATRRRSGQGSTADKGAEGTHASAQHGEGSTGGGACMKPKRTFGRTYLSRGFSGYRRPKRPGTKGRYGVKNWSADDPLPNVTRPGLAEVSASTPTGTKATVVSTVTKRSGCRRSKRRGGMR